MKGETTALKAWGKSNAKKILDQNRDTKARGFCIVHLAKSCQLSCWEKSTRQFSMNASGGLSKFSIDLEFTTEIIPAPNCNYNNPA